MAYPMSITFLGTSSGGGPTENRNCSSLVCDFFEGVNLWMVDCAEGTTRQFVLQPNRPGIPRIRIPQITKLFVTHMHGKLLYPSHKPYLTLPPADHIMGIPTLLRNLLRPPRLDAPPPPTAVDQRKLPVIHIYGPCGLRSFIRQNLKMTFTRSEDTYVVHELLRNEDPITPCNPPPDEGDQEAGSSFKEWDILHRSEVPGRDILPDEQGLWRDIASHTYSRRFTAMSVHAGPIFHREPCIGYVFDETAPPRRKVVILGDTYDPSPIIPLCSDPTPSLLVHEATDSTISPENDQRGKLSRRTLDDVMKTTMGRGHSTSIMAGEFAKRINAQKLVLNHIGSRFPAPRVGDNRGGFASLLIEDIESKATNAWNPSSGAEAIVALDFMRVLVPEPSSGMEISTPAPVAISTLTSASIITKTDSLPAKPVMASPLEMNNNLPAKPGAPWNNNQQQPSSSRGFHSMVQPQPGGPPLPSASMPISVIGQPGYYGQPGLGFDPMQMQMAQSYYAFTQMMHQGIPPPQTLAVENVQGIGIGLTGMPMQMQMMSPMEMQMQMTMTTAGVPNLPVGQPAYPYGIPGAGGVGGVPIPTPVDAAVANLTALAGALATPPPMHTMNVADRHRREVDTTGNLEELERDPVIARSIAAANVVYDSAMHESDGKDAENNTRKRKLEGDDASSREELSDL